MDVVEHPDRRLGFRGAFNFRDLGGYRTIDGSTVRWRTLFRADALHRLDEAELAELRGLGVRSVLDLRTDSEVDAGRIDADHLGITHRHYPVLGTSWKPEELDPDADAGEILGQLYIHMLDVGAPALTGCLRTMMEDESIPVVFHCAAGKDRTGVLAAIVLSLLGVDEDTIVADYSLSGRAMGELMERLTTERPELRTAMDEQPSAYLEAPPTAMRGFLDHLRVEHGSATGYVTALGIDADEIRRLRQLLLL